MGMWVFKMLPFLATRSLILLMMLASKLQGKNGENKNRIRIRISQAKAKTVGNENDKKFLQQCTEKNGHNGTRSPRGRGAGMGEWNIIKIPSIISFGKWFGVTLRGQPCCSQAQNCDNPPGKQETVGKKAPGGGSPKEKRATIAGCSSKKLN